MSQPSSSAGSTLPVLSFGSVPPVSSSSSTIPQFIQPPPSTDQDPTAHSVINVVKAVLKAKRIAVVCGAGISTASGIPDFRSSEGLFESLKRQYPEARLSSGKDLFDAGLFASEETASIFYTMIASLKQMSDKANPTAFHQFLKLLDDEGKLFRVYTQNIDGLEERAGLTRSHSPSTPPSSTSSPPPSQAQIGSLDPSGIPRCIPLHGQLSTLSCPHCSSIFSIEPYLALLSTGVPSACPTCLVTDEQRRSNGSRSRGVGRLKPDVVLYGESHPEGERVGSITRRDLMGVRPDLLIVVGTSLKVPGTKLLVRELAKDGFPASSFASATSTSSQPTGSQPRPKVPKSKPVHSIYLNLDFPTPSREWKDVFDVWMRGDVQEFVGLV
ncbi:DHS-like NAD/FAD-binding domain-containing protein, partial [Meredithblackwellia eburnea MCA 4105]